MVASKCAAARGFSRGSDVVVVLGVPPGDTQAHRGNRGGQPTSSPSSRDATDRWWPAAAFASYARTTQAVVVRPAREKSVMTVFPQADCGVRSAAAPRRCPTGAQRLRR